MYFCECRIKHFLVVKICIVRNLKRLEFVHVNMSSKNFRKVLFKAARTPLLADIEHLVGSEGSVEPLSNASTD